MTVRERTPDLLACENPTLPGLQPDMQTTAQPEPTTVILGSGGKVLAELVGDDDDDFKWEPGNLDIVTVGAPSTAVYLNRWDQIVIRQEGEYSGDDPYVRIDRRDVPALIKRLETLCHGA